MDRYTLTDVSTHSPLFPRPANIFVLPYRSFSRKTDFLVYAFVGVISRPLLNPHDGFYLAILKD